MRLEPINTVTEAIALLRRIGVETIGISDGWILHGTSPDDEFELTADTSAELIEYARYERDLCIRLGDELGAVSPEELFAHGSDLPAIEVNHRISKHSAPGKEATTWIH